MKNTHSKNTNDVILISGYDIFTNKYTGLDNPINFQLLQNQLKLYDAMINSHIYQMFAPLYHMHNDTRIYEDFYEEVLNIDEDEFSKQDVVKSLSNNFQNNYDFIDGDRVDITQPNFASQYVQNSSKNTIFAVTYHGVPSYDGKSNHIMELDDEKNISSASFVKQLMKQHAKNLGASTAMNLLFLSCYGGYLRYDINSHMKLNAIIIGSPQYSSIALPNNILIMDMLKHIKNQGDFWAAAVFATTHSQEEFTVVCNGKQHIVRNNAIQSIKERHDTYNELYQLDRFLRANAKNYKSMKEYHQDEESGKHITMFEKCTVEELLEFYGDKGDLLSVYKIFQEYPEIQNLPDNINIAESVYEAIDEGLDEVTQKNVPNSLNYLVKILKDPKITNSVDMKRVAVHIYPHYEMIDGKQRLIINASNPISDQFKEGMTQSEKVEVIISNLEYTNGFFDSLDAKCK